MIIDNIIKTVFITFILIAIPSYIIAQKKNYQVVDTIVTKSMENNNKKFDIEHFEKHKESWTWNYSIFNSFKEDGTRIKQTKYIDDYFFEEDKNVVLGYRERENKILRPLGIYNDSYYTESETPPYPKLYIIQRKYYLNGNLKSEGIQLPGDLPIGIWREYGEDGNLIEETNYDETYGKFDYNQVILFLAKKGHIDIKTGRGREDIIIGFADGYWHVKYNPSERNGYKPGVYYILDKDTGKVKKKVKILPSGS